MKRAYNLEDSSGNSKPEEQQHAFHVGTGVSNGIVDIKVGFINIKSALIDSGASCNLMDRNIGNIQRENNMRLVCLAKTSSRL